MAKPYVMKDGDRIERGSCLFEPVDANGTAVQALVVKPNRLVRADGKEMPLGTFISASRDEVNKAAKAKKKKDKAGE